MIYWKLALKRALKPGGLCMLLILALTVWCGKTVTHQASLRPCGVVCEDDHPTAREVRELLTARGFASYDSREAMETDISMGRLDCGAVLLPGLGAGVEKAEYAGFVLLLTAPDSFLTEVYRAHIGSALYTAAAPAMVEQSAHSAGVSLTREEARQALQEMSEEGLLFTFDVVTTEGVAPAQPDLGRQVALAAAALLLFAMVPSGVIRIAREAERVRPRIGRRAAVTGVLLPGIICRLVLCAAAAGIPLGADAVRLPGYLLALTGLGLAAAAVRLDLKPLLPALLLGGLALTPLYFDLCGAYPWLVSLRLVLPPCWLTTGNPLSVAAAGAGLTALTLALYCIRRST